MTDAPAPVFETVVIGDRKLVVCRLGDVTGTARVGSGGETEARDRALAQARSKLAQRP